MEQRCRAGRRPYGEEVERERRLTQRAENAQRAEYPRSQAFVRPAAIAVKRDVQRVIRVLREDAGHEVDVSRVVRRNESERRRHADDVCKRHANVGFARTRSVVASGADGTHSPSLSQRTADERPLVQRSPITDEVRTGAPLERRGGGACRVRDGRDRDDGCNREHVVTTAQPDDQVTRRHNCIMNTADLRRRVEEFIRAHGLIPSGGEVTVLVSGGADSTCAWHVLRTLGYRVAALHVDHGLRGNASAADALFCAERLGAQVVDGRGGRTEDELRKIRYSFATDRLRATGHTASDQVETVLYRLVASGAAKGIKPRREDRVVRPLLRVWRDETAAYCRAEGLEFRVDASNRDTKRGLIRDEILPRVRELHPAAERNLLRLAEQRPSKLDELLAARAGSRRVDLGNGLTAVREYDRVWLEQSPVALTGEVRWGPWRIESDLPGLKVRAWRAGDRLAGRSKKIQDVFVDAKVPRSLRESWPLVVRGDEVVAVPGIVELEGVRAFRADEAPHNAIRGRGDMRGASTANLEEGGSRGKRGFPRESEP